MTKQRYDCMMVGMAEGYGRMAQVDSGGYVLYTDHLAVVAEKDKRADEIAEKTIKAFERYEEQIAALTAEFDRMRKNRDGLEQDWYALESGAHKAAEHIAALQAEVAERVEHALKWARIAGSNQKQINKLAGEVEALTAR